MLLIGIDEAGYGPLLGPLCHGSCALSVPGADLANPPDLWEHLYPLVTRVGGAGLVVDDSKKVYQGRQGLETLEKSVQAFYASISQKIPASLIPDSDVSEIKKDVWIKEAILLQHSMGVAEFSNLEFEIKDYSARMMSARQFNEHILRGANKAELSWRVIATELKRLVELSPSGEAIFAAIDRQGGRKFYAGLLGEVFGTALVQIECESETASVYRLDYKGRSLRVGFFVGGESQHMAIALASMIAKLVREKYMLQFNSFFQQHQTYLAATAGYYTDAMRFLRETKELRARLKIADEHLIRVK